MKTVFTSLLMLPLAVIGAEDLPELAPPYGELPPAFWEQNRMLIAIGAFLLLGMAALLTWQWRRPRSKAVLPPDKIASDALSRLRHEPEDGTTLSAVSQILHRYIGARFKLQADGLTTAEFCSAVTAHPQIGGELANAIVSFLQECDVRKFSPTHASAAMNAVNRALEFVIRAEQQANAQTPK